MVEVNVPIFAFLHSEPDAEDPEPLRLIILGAGGSGKTYVITVMKAFINFWLEKDAAQQIAFLNSVAAMVEGRTIHSALGIGFGSLSDSSTAGAEATALDGIHGSFAECKAVFVDEIGMVSTSLLSKLSERLCDVKGKSKGASEPFGNLAFIASGDFLQLPPVRALSLAFPLENVSPFEVAKLSEKQKKEIRFQSRGSRHVARVDRCDSAPLFPACFWRSNADFASHAHQQSYL